MKKQCWGTVKMTPEKVEIREVTKTTPKGDIEEGPAHPTQKRRPEEWQLRGERRKR